MQYTLKGTIDSHRHDEAVQYTFKGTTDFHQGLAAMQQAYTYKEWLRLPAGHCSNAVKVKITTDRYQDITTILLCNTFLNTVLLRLPERVCSNPTRFKGTTDCHKKVTPMQ